MLGNWVIDADGLCFFLMWLMLAFMVGFTGGYLADKKERKKKEDHS